MATARLMGSSIKRREDPRFITGKGNYTDDLKLPGMTYAAFVRSEHANARIRGIDTARARAHPGVVAIFTGKDMTGGNPGRGRGPHNIVKAIQYAAEAMAKR